LSGGAGLQPYRLAPATRGRSPGRPPLVRRRGGAPGQGLLPDRERLIVYALLAGLLVVVFAAGLKGLGAARPLFILGCLGVAWRAWRVGPGLHIEVAITLFALAPFLRRVVDYHAGYNPNGIMLIGPLAALLVALPELRGLLLRRQRGLAVYAPYAIMIACILYGWSISAFQGDFVEAAVSGVKMLVPLLYAMCLIQNEDDCNEIVQAAARTFLFISPIIGLYGIYQYMHPPEWDRYWMIYSQMRSIGMPEARQLRVFSTMNSPASFAMFVSCGLLLFGFCRRGWLPAVLAVPVCLSLLLTTVRTAWISVAIGVIYCFFFNTTRSRALLLTIGLFGAAAAAVLLTPFGDEIATRLATLSGDPSQDGSGHARLGEVFYIYSSLDHYLFGNGFSKVYDPKLMDVDGQLIASAVSMGIFIGNIHLIALIWAAVQGILKIRRDEQPLRLVAAAMVVGYLFVLPLLVVSSGEIAFLFWLFVGVLTAGAQAAAARSVPAGARVAPMRHDLVSGTSAIRPGLPSRS